MADYDLYIADVVHEEQKLKEFEEKEKKNMNNARVEMKNSDGLTYSFLGKLEATTPSETKAEPRLIAGKLNNCRTICYWEVDADEDFEIGDYAVVENMNDYDLVKIVGEIYTNDKYKKFITNNNKLKKVVKIVERDEIRED